MRLVALLLAVYPVAAQAPAILSPAMLNGLYWRSIGPAATGGRIADLAVSQVPGKPDELYVATTSGGIFKSVNGGVSFTPIFDQPGGMMSIGAVAVAPSNPSIVWAGGGEADNRQSSSWGDGVYKSFDGGRSWQRMGLEETRHIGRIVIHPTDPNIVYVAAVGHLWGSNSERGVFKTSDGGKTWKKVLYKDEHTGATDLVLDPRNPNVVFAAMYQRQRKGWGFNGGGPGSGIFRTSDGGATWTEMTNGLPRGDKGRIGLCLFAADSRIVYAIVEAALGRGIYRSLDQGENWEQLSSVNPRPSYYSRIYVDPKSADRIYIMGSNRGLFISDDAGRSFHDVFSGVHGEDHALWINPANTNHLIAGGDGGVSISYDRGLTWLFRINLPIGQFYTISTNNRDPFLVCGGLQDNGSWCTPSATNMAYGISFKEAFNIGSGDGMHAVFEGDDHTVLVSSQNGVTSRLDLDNMERQTIGPVQPIERPQAGQPGYRWYWTTPLIVSHFNPNTIYTGANVLFRSEDRGVSWKPISPDLTANVDRDQLQMMGAPVPPNALSRHDGQSNYSALTTIAESPLDKNVIYTGADDGSLHMTRDGGRHWTSLTSDARGNISSIEASKHSPGRVYLTVDAHFDDDYRPYVSVSEDYGQTWRGITAGLPQASVHRIREHPTNPNLLVAGLEMGAYISFDRGVHWTAFGENLPPVPVYDLAFQGGSNALVLGTHGRSIWVLDHIEPLVQMTGGAINGGPHLFPIPPTHHRVIYSGQFWFGAGEFFSPNPPYGALITYYLPAPSRAVEISIADAAGKPVRTLRGPAQAGMNRVAWDLRMEGGGPVVLPGKYIVGVTGAGQTELTVQPDPKFAISDADRKARFSAIMGAYTLQQQLAPAREAARQSANPEASRLSGEINRILQSAANVQNAMDAYSGLPTAAQLRQLDWAWEDAIAAVNALNKLRHGEKAVPVPSRKR
jgi:photosystem II stability/assembly factor-like uncharacterized protein